MTTLTSILLNELGKRVMKIIVKHVEPQHRKKFARVIGASEPCISVCNDDNDEFVFFRNGVQEDGEYDNLELLIANGTEVTVHVVYFFGRGHFKDTPKKNLFEGWETPFGDYEIWEPNVINDLEAKFGASFPTIEIDSDSDFGYQSFFVRLKRKEN